jgi:hypothetical protein
MSSYRILYRRNKRASYKKSYMLLSFVYSTCPSKLFIHKLFTYEALFLLWLTKRTAVLLLRILQGFLVLSRPRIKQDVWRNVYLRCWQYCVQGTVLALFFYVPFTKSYKITRMKMLKTLNGNGEDRRRQQRRSTPVSGQAHSRSRNFSLLS